MEIVAVCGLSYSDFVIGRLSDIGRADILVLSFGAVETVDFKKEIQRDINGVFVDLCTLSYDLNCAVLCGADTDVYGIKHKSVIIADKGQLIDVSDMVNAPDGFDAGGAYRSYKTSAGVLGVVVDGDIMCPDSAKAAALNKADMIINIADKDIENKQILTARAAGLLNNTPVLLCAKNYALLSDKTGEVKFAGSAGVNVFSFA